jgi:hypothetical protein
MSHPCVSHAIRIGHKSGEAPVGYDGGIHARSGHSRCGPGCSCALLVRRSGTTSHFRPSTTCWYHDLSPSDFNPKEMMLCRCLTALLLLYNPTTLEARAADMTLSAQLACKRDVSRIRICEITGRWRRPAMKRSSRDLPSRGSFLVLRTDVDPSSAGSMLTAS